MKAEQIEEPTDILRWIENCNQVLSAMPADGEPDPPWLDMNRFVSNCGTHRCWLGDYMLRKFDDANKADRMCGLIYGDNQVAEFGGYIYDKVFSSSHDAPTSERKATLQAHIDRLIQKLVESYAALEAGSAEA